jgi:predicted Zn-dependent protease with MMP-like domain
MNWSELKAPSLDDLEILAQQTFSELPEGFRVLVTGIVFVVADFPDDEVRRDLELESEFEILGLFQGPDLANRTANSNGAHATMIFLYRRPILDYWSESDDTLGDIIRHVLIHEIGHHFGLSDDGMESIEAQIS